MKTAILSAGRKGRPLEASDLLRVERQESVPMLTVAALSRGLSVLAVSGCAALAVVALARREAEPPAAPARAAVAARAPSGEAVRQVRGADGVHRDAAAPAPVAPSPAPAQVQAVQVQPAQLQPLQVASAAPAVVEAPAWQARAPEPALEAPAYAAVAPMPTQPTLERAVAASEAVAAAASVVPEAAAEVPAAADGGVDLNTASLDALNGLNAGMIGRAIVRGRPYGAPEELVARRILTRANFEKIKGRISVGAAR